MVKQLSRGLVAALLLPSLGGCVGMTVGMTAPVVKIASANFNRESDLELAREATPGQLKTADGFLAADPENKTLLDVCAEGYLEYAFGFLEDDIEQTPEDDKHAARRENLIRRATGMYERALGYAVRRLQLADGHFPEALAKDAGAVTEEAKNFDKSEQPALFFAGLALGSSINLNRNDVTRVADLPKAVAILKRAYEIDKNFFNGGPAMAMGVFTGSTGKAMGGDPEASKRYFNEALDASGGKYLMTKVMMARTLAVTTQDRPLFEKLLKEVINAPANIYPEYRLPNEAAKKRAARYLAHVDDYF